MTQKAFLRGLLIAVLCAIIATPARAETITAARDQLVIGIVVVAAGIAVLTTFLILHNKHQKRAITGCVGSAPSGMSLTDEKDQRIYSLSGDTAGVKPGERMSLEGKPRTSGKTLVLDVHIVTKDLGACQPLTGSL